MLKRMATAAMAAGSLVWVMALSPVAHGASQAPPSASAAGSQAPTPLDRYLEHLKTLRVTFLQTVADAHGAEVGRSSGTLIVERPGKFRWEIQPQAAASAAPSSQGASAGQGSASSGGQVMVSDGHNLWYYDRDLQQVTVRPMPQPAAGSPSEISPAAPR
jgi:outer membrane lipoprotein carrier protein